MLGVGGVHRKRRRSLSASNGSNGGSNGESNGGSNGRRRKRVATLRLTRRLRKSIIKLYKEERMDIIKARRRGDKSRDPLPSHVEEASAPFIAARVAARAKGDKERARARKEAPSASSPRYARKVRVVCLPPLPRPPMLAGEGTHANPTPPRPREEESIILGHEIVERRKERDNWAEIRAQSRIAPTRLSPWACKSAPRGSVQSLGHGNDGYGYGIGIGMGMGMDDEDGLGSAKFSLATSERKVRKGKARMLAEHLVVGRDEVPSGEPERVGSVFELKAIVRAHASVNRVDADDSVDVVRCAFKPSLDPSRSEPSIVATVGGTVVALIDCESRRVTKKCTPDPAGNDTLTCLAWSILPGPEEWIILAVAGLGGTLYLLAPELNMLYHAIPIGAPVADIAFHPTLTAVVAVLTTTGRILLYDVLSEPVIVASIADAQGLTSIAFSHPGTLLYGARNDGALSVWRLGDDGDQSDVLYPISCPPFSSFLSRARIPALATRLTGVHVPVGVSSLSSLFSPEQDVYVGRVDDESSLSVFTTIWSDDGSTCSVMFQGYLGDVDGFRGADAPGPVVESRPSINTARDTLLVPQNSGDIYVYPAKDLVELDPCFPRGDDEDLPVSLPVSVLASSRSIHCLLCTATSLFGRWIVGVGAGNSVLVWER